MEGTDTSLPRLGNAAKPFCYEQLGNQIGTLSRSVNASPHNEFPHCVLLLLSPSSSQLSCARTCNLSTVIDTFSAKRPTPCRKCVPSPVHPEFSHLVPCVELYACALRYCDRAVLSDNDRVRETPRRPEQADARGSAGRHDDPGTVQLRRAGRRRKIATRSARSGRQVRAPDRGRVGDNEQSRCRDRLVVGGCDGDRSGHCRDHGDGGRGIGHRDGVGDADVPSRGSPCPCPRWRDGRRRRRHGQCQRP